MTHMSYSSKNYAYKVFSLIFPFCYDGKKIYHMPSKGGDNIMDKNKVLGIFSTSPFIKIHKR